LPTPRLLRAPRGGHSRCWSAIAPLSWPVMARASVPTRLAKPDLVIVDGRPRGSARQPAGWRPRWCRNSWASAPQIGGWRDCPPKASWRGKRDSNRRSTRSYAAI